MPGAATTHAESNRLIYVVDDEEVLLETAEVALLAEGYALKKFRCPQAALDSFTQETPKPSLLVTDYAMSPMDGIELSTKCKSAHPGLKIMLVSGTAGPEIVLQSPVAVDKFMQKPYKLAELASTVRSLLDVSPV
jgi:DNA-binding NtrC family response regulator